MLLVVQHEQHPAVGQLRCQRPSGWEVRGQAQVQRVGDSRAHQIRRSDRRQIHKRHLPVAFFGHLGGGAQGQPGLAATARTSQGHQPVLLH
jgi:hypothetical protein